MDKVQPLTKPLSEHPDYAAAALFMANGDRLDVLLRLLAKHHPDILRRYLP